MTLIVDSISYYAFMLRQHNKIYKNVDIKILKYYILVK